MSPDQYQQLLDENERLCRAYNDSEDIAECERLLERIAVTEFVLFHAEVSS
jgi:hypothetical protein